MKKYILILSAVICFMFGSMTVSAASNGVNQSYGKVTYKQNVGNNEFNYYLDFTVQNISTSNYQMFAYKKTYLNDTDFGLAIISQEPFSYSIRVSSDKFGINQVYSGNAQIYKGYYFYRFGHSLKLFDFNASDLPVAEFYNSDNDLKAWIDANLPLTYPVPEPDDYLLSPELGYLADVEKHTKIYEITDDVADTFVENRIYRFGWSNKTTSGIDLWRNSYDRMQIQVNVEAKGNIRDYRGNVIDSVRSNIFKEPFDVTQITYSYSTTDFINDFPEFVNQTNYTNAYTDVTYTVFFRILAEKDGEYLRGNWLCVKPSYSTNSWGLIDNADVSVNSGDLNISDSGSEFIPNGDISVNTQIGHGAGSSEIEASNNNSIFVNPDQPTELFTSLSSIASSIAAVPQLIGIIFSFLPGWVLTLVGAQFAFIILLITIKFIRG